MGLFSKLFQDTQSASSAGSEYGESLADQEPGYSGRGLAFEQRKAYDLARSNGLTHDEANAFEEGMFESYMNKARGRK